MDKGDTVKFSVFIRFVDPDSNKVTEKFLALVEVEENKAATASKAFFFKNEMFSILEY